MTVTISEDKEEENSVEDSNENNNEDTPGVDSLQADSVEGTNSTSTDMPATAEQDVTPGVKGPSEPDTEGAADPPGAEPADFTPEVFDEAASAALLDSDPPNPPPPVGKYVNDFGVQWPHDYEYLFKCHDTLARCVSRSSLVG